MTHAKRIKQLSAIGWLPGLDPVSKNHIQYQINGERVWHIECTISGVATAAWMRDKDGFVFVQIAGPDEGMDFEFDAFCELVKDGWPVAKVAPVARGLFDGED